MKLGISLLLVDHVIPQGFGPGNSGLGGPDIINFGLDDDGKGIFENNSFLLLCKYEVLWP